MYFFRFCNVFLMAAHSLQVLFGSLLLGYVGLG